MSAHNWRETSAEAFAAIRASGYLADCEKKVVTYIYEQQNKPWAGGMISQKDLARAFSDISRSYGNRCNVLVKKGVLYEVGKKEDAQTGHKVLGYRLTGELPHAVAKGRSRVSCAVALTRLIGSLRVRIEALQPVLTNERKRQGKVRRLALVVALRNFVRDVQQDMTDAVLRTPRSPE